MVTLARLRSRSLNERNQIRGLLSIQPQALQDQEVEDKQGRSRTQGSPTLVRNRNRGRVHPRFSGGHGRHYGSPRNCRLRRPQPGPSTFAAGANQKRRLVSSSSIRLDPGHQTAIRTSLRVCWYPSRCRIARRVTAATNSARPAGCAHRHTRSTPRRGPSRARVQPSDRQRPVRRGVVPPRRAQHTSVVDPFESPLVRSNTLTGLTTYACPGPPVTVCVPVNGASKKYVRNPTSCMAHVETGQAPG